jgi:hypothetical protein
VDRIEIANAVYERAFPAVIIVCAVVGTISFALADYSQSIAAFVAIGLGVKLNGMIERRRFERSERLAGLGWTRARTPMSTL